MSKAWTLYAQNVLNQVISGKLGKPGYSMNHETRLYQALKEPEYRTPLPSGKIGEGAPSPIFPAGRGGCLYTG